MRAIIRFSIDNEKNGVLSGKLRKYLEKRKFTKLPGGTATYENRKTTERKLRFTMRNFWLIIEQHRGPGRIDHFWMYADRS
jgi:hypothetical protein